jgi:hypothetical protein
MADTKIELGRGPRGERGERGRVGSTGPTGPAGATGPLTTFIFRPGDPAGNRDSIYTDWPTLYAALQQVAGQLVELQFDERFVAPASIIIPAGTWNMFNVTWTNVADAGNVINTNIELADGAQIILEPDAGVPGNNCLRLFGYGIAIISNRKGPIAPFDNTNGQFGGCEIGGGGIRFYNTDPAALPMFVAKNNGLFILFDGAETRGGFGEYSIDSGTAVAPIVDAAGNFVFIALFSGDINNNAFTDTVGGGTVQIAVFDDSSISDVTNAWDFPALVARGGILVLGAASRYTSSQQTRSRINSGTGTPLIVTPALSPYAAAYNEIVFVNTSTGPVTINMPTAAPAAGENLIVKDSGGAAATNPITISPAAGNTVDNGTISNNSGSKTWVSDGLGRWNLVAVV